MCLAYWREKTKKQKNNTNRNYHQERKSLTDILHVTQDQDVVNGKLIPQVKGPGVDAPWGGRFTRSERICKDSKFSGIPESGVGLDGGPVRRPSDVGVLPGRHIGQRADWRHRKCQSCDVYHEHVLLLLIDTYVQFVSRFGLVVSRSAGTKAEGPRFESPLRLTFPFSNNCG